MSNTLAMYLVGYPPSALAIAISAERERRLSRDPVEQRATLQPALAGLSVGLVWPGLLGAALVVGMLFLLSRAVQWLVDRIEARS